MTTQKQIEANQENGKKGGVKTEEGKAISKYNAIKHGILTKDIILAEENQEELEKLGKLLRKEFEPKSEIELILVDRITANVWRLKRVLKAEAEMIEGDISSVFANKKNFGNALSYDFANYDSYGKFTRYESSIERGIYKAIHELERIQGKRKGENIPPPLVADIDVSKDEDNGFVSQ